MSSDTGTRGGPSFSRLETETSQADHVLLVHSRCSSAFCNLRSQTQRHPVLLASGPNDRHSELDHPRFHNTHNDRVANASTSCTCSPVLRRAETSKHRCRPISHHGPLHGSGCIRRLCAPLCGLDTADPQRARVHFLSLDWGMLVLRARLQPSSGPSKPTYRPYCNSREGELQSRFLEDMAGKPSWKIPRSLEMNSKYYFYTLIVIPLWNIVG